MELTIKSIINSLFEAKIRYQGIEVTAIGETEEIATQNALNWLKRELEILSYESDQQAIEALMQKSQEEQPLYVLKGEEWKKREKEIQLVAYEVGKIAVKSAARYAVKASVGGIIGLIM